MFTVDKEYLRNAYTWFMQYEKIIIEEKTEKDKVSATSQHRNIDRFTLLKIAWISILY